MEQENRLTEIFAEVGKANGYKDVNASYAAFGDFKVKWSRSYTWISFEVSDYLMGAPDNIMTSLAESVYAKIKNVGSGDYPQDVCDWLSSPSFVDSNQMLYVKRCRGISRGTVGNCRDLCESVLRLEDEDLVEHDPMLVVRWNSGSTWKASTKSSTLMKVVRVADTLDSFDIPDCVVDYSVYSALIRISQGFGQQSPAKRAEYSKMLELYPYQEEAEYGLRRINMTI